VNKNEIKNNINLNEIDFDINDLKSSNCMLNSSEELNSNRNREEDEIVST
jgi:hypothetical protein